MPAREPIVELGDFSSPGADATPWPAVLRVLRQAEVFRLSTVRKARNVSASNRCVLTTGTNVYSQTRYRFAGRS